MRKVQKAAETNETLAEPVVLEDEQAKQVSGGLLLARGGCPACSSGVQLAFQTLEKQA